MRRANIPPKVAAASLSVLVLMGNMQLFKAMWDRKRKFTPSLFSNKGRQKSDEWMQHIETFCLQQT